MVMKSRRRLRWHGETPAAPRLVVGDRVLVTAKDGDGVVEEVCERTSALHRSAPHSGRPQILAANVDQALVVFAASRPEPKRGLVDRFLAACALASIDAVIVLNKVDLGTAAVDEWIELYGELGYQVLRTSARTGWGLGRVRRRLNDRTTLFCGPSGAGKSSLLNAVVPGFRLKVGSISSASGKGRHTTTRAELMPLPSGGFVVDTPGLKEFGLTGATGAELEKGFPEIRVRSGGCRFADCSHTHEPDCAVRAAVDEGLIDAGRYDSFIKIRDGE